jgi:hypothetical protein
MVNFMIIMNDNLLKTWAEYFLKYFKILSRDYSEDILT